MSEIAPDILLGEALEHQRQGRLGEAEALCRQVLRSYADHPGALHVLGFLYATGGDKGTAVQLLARAAAGAPHDPTIFSNLGIWLAELGRFDEALAAHQGVLRLMPKSHVAYYNLGTALMQANRLKEASDAFAKALQLDGTNHAALINLAHMQADMGQLDEAINTLRGALQAGPHSAVHSSLLFLMQFHPVFGGEAMLRELAAWDQAHGMRGFARVHRNGADPERPLRVGYVSGDFRDHVVGHNILPLIEKHDPAAFQVFCFSETRLADAFTERVRRAAVEFHPIAGRGDEDVAQLILSRQIDILVDLSLHTGSNRLPVFARRPAPIQVTFAGYPGSTGLSAMDYRLTDRQLESAGTAFIETPMFLTSFWCFDSFGEASEVGPLPALAAGCVTFGCLNAFRKVNAETLRRWARVLCAVPGSRLLVSVPRDAREFTAAVLQQAGVATGRIEFCQMMPRHEYLRAYQRIDIALDTLPYNGHSTTLDGLYMGVPVVTRVGNTCAGRAGLSQLTNLGLGDLAGHTDEEFRSIAAELSCDLPRLAELRRTLRGRMEASPLMDAARFAREIEVAYRTMWREWCMHCAAR